MAGNGDAQRLERLETTLRGETDAVTEEFTLARLAEFFVVSGQQKREITSECASRLLETTERELAYLRRFVGKLK